MVLQRLSYGLCLVNKMALYIFRVHSSHMMPLQNSLYLHNTWFPQANIIMTHEYLDLILIYFNGGLLSKHIARNSLRKQTITTI